MNPLNVIPTIDPNPLPAPYWVFKVLLVVTFFLHIVAMNFLLGGGVLALVSKWGSRKPDLGHRMFHDLARKLPVLVPATVTLGIAPLLFLQVLYGQFFYASSIVMAWPWFLVLVGLTIAYYGFYYVSFRGGREIGRAGALMLLSVLLIFLVGFLFSNNLTLSQSPSRWAGKYFANPAGWNLNLTEPALIPRFLHFFIAAVAVGGLFLVFLAWARWKADNAYARQLLRFGGKAFMYATMAQFATGIVFLATLPRALRMLFMGDNAAASILFLVGVLGGIGAIFLMSEAVRKENIRMAALYVPAVLAGVIACMCIMRDMLRDACLKPYFHPAQFAIHTQWSVLPLFLALFAGGAVLWLVMLKRYGLLASKSP
jgi:hypothetical protein